MRTVIFFPQSDNLELAPLTHTRPFPLLEVGGRTIIGHTMTLLDGMLDKGVILAGDVGLRRIAAAIQTQLPDVPVQFMSLIDWDFPPTMLHDGVLLVDGRFLTNFDETVIKDIAADAIMFTNEEAPSHIGACWVKNGQILQGAAEEMATEIDLGLSQLDMLLRQQQAKVVAEPARFCLSIQTMAQLNYANTRLLGLGYGSEDVIDRSYAEDFTALTPIFLHETAVVDGCVIGPYVHIGANARIKNSIIRNSIIYPNAVIQDCLLDRAVIGANSTVTGRGKKMIVGDDSIVDLS